MGKKRLTPSIPHEEKVNGYKFRRVDLCKFSIKHHGDKIEYFRLYPRDIWLLFKKVLQGWKIKVTAVKAIDRNEMFFTIVGEK